MVGTPSARIRHIHLIAQHIPHHPGLHPGSQGLHHRHVVQRGQSLIDGKTDCARTPRPNTSSNNSQNSRSRMTASVHTSRHRTPRSPATRARATPDARIRSGHRTIANGVAGGHRTAPPRRHRNDIPKSCPLVLQRVQVISHQPQHLRGLDAQRQGDRPPAAPSWPPSARVRPRTGTPSDTPAFSLTSRNVLWVAACAGHAQHMADGLAQRHLPWASGARLHGTAGHGHACVRGEILLLPHPLQGGPAAPPWPSWRHGP